MRQVTQPTEPPDHGDLVTPRVHHIAVQTSDLANSASWYLDFLGCHQSWSLSTFSELTRRRLPGITTLTELVAGNLRLHLFERPGDPAPDPALSVTAFQHVCFAVHAPDDLVRLRRRWIDLYRSGRYAFALAEQPTEVVINEDGVQSFYAYDVNGLEFEFSYLPSGVA